MSEVTRKDFLKTAGIASAAIAGSAVVAPVAMADEAPMAAEGMASDYPIAVHETDILIIGGGLCGCQAARAAFSEGATDVTVVDKGPWGHSGTSGINWGHDMTTPEWAEPGTAGVINAYVLAGLTSGLVDQNYAYAFGEMMQKYRANRSYEQMGGLVYRGEDGLVGTSIQRKWAPVGNEGQTDPVPFTLTHSYYNRYPAQWVKRQGAKIYDWTEVLDLLYGPNGEVAGAVAFSRKDGSAHVFRAKAVVMAMGAYAYVSGWNGMGAHTIAGPEATGDAHYMLMKHGVPMRDMEFQPCDFVQWTPAATRQGMGAMGASIVNWPEVYDVDGTCVCTSTEERATGFTQLGWDNAEFMACCLATIHDGKGGPNGGIFVDMDAIEAYPNDPYYLHCRETLARFGYEDPQFLELCPEQWESAGQPFNLTLESEVAEVPGLFFTSGASGAAPGCVYVCCYGTGLLAGEGAAHHVAAMDVAPAIDMDAARAALDEAYALLDAEPENPVRSLDVQRMIQNAYWEGIGPWRNEAGMTAAIAELDRIESEVLPNMYVPCKSKTMNSDWWKAIEAKHMIMCAKGTGYAALDRKESRGPFCREDYPAKDNENFMKNSKLTYADGVYSVEFVDMVTTIDPAESLSVRMPQVGFPIEQ